MTKKKITMENIKDWFIIQRIRILNFIKEHKYLSAGIGVFLLSCIVYLVAFSASNDYNGMATISVTPKQINGVDSITEIKSFSTVVYDIEYMLDVANLPEDALIRDEVIIEATFKNSHSDVNDIDAEWLIYSDESSDYELSDDKKTLTVTLHSIEAGKQNKKQLYLKVNNIKGDGDSSTPEITTIIKAKESTSEFSEEVVNLSVLNTEELSLTYELVGGTAYNDESCPNGRCAPFGIVAGIDRENLEGIYFNPDLEIDLSASDSTGVNLELLLDDEKFGIYDNTEMSTIRNMPDKAYNSGNVNLSKSESSGSAIITQEVSLVGEEEVSLKVGEEYKELGIVLNDGSKAFCYETTENVCERKIDGTDEDIIDTSKEGEHTITYNYLSKTLTRKVIVEGEKTSVVDSAENIYSVSGNEVVTLLKDEEFFDEGILGLEYEVYITNDETGEEVEEINTANVGNYTISYVNLITEEGEELEGEELLRKVNVVLDYGKSQTTQITQPASPSLDGNNYKLKINGIKSNATIDKFGNKIVLGTYYVTVNSVRPSGNSSDIMVTLKSSDKTASVENKLYSAGTKIASLTFNSDETGDLVEHSSNSVLSYGEETILKSQFEYLTDGDDTISNYVDTIDFSNAKFELLEYSATEDKNIYISINEKEAIYNSTDKSLKYLDGSSALNDIDSFELIINKDEHSKLTSIIYKIGRVNQGTKIDFRIRLKTLKENESGKAVTISSAYTYTQNGSHEASKSSSIMITAFKSRTSLLVNDCNYDIVVNGAVKEEQISIWKVYPEITSYVENNDIIKEIKIDVILPKGINYVYDENYEIPTIVNSNDGTKILKYTIQNTKINEWVDPIVFETSYDVDIPSGTNLEVKAIISATTINSVTDASAEEYRTTRRFVTYQNNEKLATSLYTSHIAVPKDTEFDINTKIYKNGTENFDDLDIITILPNNDGSDKNSFSGTYLLSGLSEGSLCTTEESVTKTNMTSIEWVDCSQFEDSEYLDVTAIKKANINLNEENKYFEDSFNISPQENNTDDIYTIKSYIFDNTSSNIIEIPDLTITVISKKITGIVWEDFNSNGIMEEQEKRIPDVKFILFNAETNEEVSTTLSNENGEYKLTDVEPGNYYIVAEYNSSKYGITAANIGFDKSIMSVYETETLNSDESIALYSNYIVTNDISEDAEGDEGWNDGEDLGDTEGDEGWNDGEDLGDIEGDGDNVVEDSQKLVVKSKIITITDNTKVVNNINLGLTLKKVYTVKMNKFITKAIITNNLGATTTKDYGKTTLAKLDVKDINNLNIKVIYTLEIENIGYYPGYVYNIKDYIPDGMTFNKDYEENKGWSLNEDGYVENNTLFDELLDAGDKKYLTLALDISRKEAGSFVNYAVIEDEDLQMLVVDQEFGDVGD